MPRIYTLQTNFSSGELDPVMHFRADTGAYQNGAHTLTNCLLLNSGGCARRPGTKGVQAAALPGLCRLEAFEFSDDERYVLAFSNGRLDVYGTDGAFVVSVTSGCNWTTATLFEFTVSQAADTMIVAHRSWATQVIRRTSLTTFTVTNLAFRQSTNGNKIYQPYFKFVADDVTLSASATTGTATLTASAGVFEASMVGERLRWGDVEIEVTAFTDATTMTGTILGTLEARYDNNPFRTREGTGVVEVTHVLHGFATGASVTISGAGSVGGITAAQINGAKTITVLDDNTYTITTAGTATESIDGGGPSAKYGGANLATRNWSEPAFSSRNGYPGAVCFHEGRLWFGGSAGVPDGLWGSKLFDFFNFDVGEGLAADSVQVTVGADDISNIQHLVSNNDLQIFTATAEFVAVAPRLESLSPSNITIRRQTPYGCSFVPPMPFDGATVYLQESQTALREYIYSDATARYASTNLNVLSGHLLSAPYDMAVLYGGSIRSEQYAYLVNDDGSIAVFHSARSEQLAGWAKWLPGGAGNPAFKSVCVVGTETYVCTLRHGSYWLEQFSQDRQEVLDGFVTYSDATAKRNWTVGAQFYGKVVEINSGNYHLGTFTVGAAGELDVVVDVKEITVGYGYTWAIRTLPVDVTLANGPSTGRPKRISRVFAGIDATLALSISGNRLVLRQVTDDFSIEPEPVSQTYEFRLLGFAKNAFVEVTQTEPLPATLLGMAMEVSV